MLDFLRLVSNENMKIYRRARTWIMMGILLLLTVSITGMATFLTADEPPTMWFMMKMETQILLTLATILPLSFRAKAWPANLLPERSSCC
ncbi:hypothetical protein PACILC2_21450 [Paenibacillus cisolokensis]|uniref:Uncharacterized protein n=1 Tax=Paenibacillus cisolokensis TaxID=1658519 RepID=A0ABQ4N603_9BACL|nr:hypothetical protein [Paenibacillus cisolokensis]GIQ63577.1 hypothetical protein PACILC2_21450 [Paenibacillus cisolokensis]